MSTNWIDDELSRKQNSEKQIESFHEAYFTRYSRLRPHVINIFQYIEKAQQIGIKIQFLPTKEEFRFEYQFKYIPSFPKHNARFVTFTFQERSVHPKVDIEFSEDRVESEQQYNSDGYYLDTEFRVVPVSRKIEYDMQDKLNDNVIGDILGWLCYKNQIYTDTSISKPKVNNSSCLVILMVLIITSVTIFLNF
ncbi:MAG: hypothetical protein WCF67_19215 [Chitinophagaceae bacterium]